MDLVLWRHAEAQPAVPGQRDLERPLTAPGEREAEGMAEWLDQRLPEATRIVVSPALRCQQTAAALGRRHDTVAALAPDLPVEQLLDAAGWPRAGGVVLVVGHQPTIGLAVAQLLSARALAWSVPTGSVWWLRLREGGPAGQAVLRSMQSPDLL